jgi:hypothetical protein
VIAVLSVFAGVHGNAFACFSLYVSSSLSHNHRKLAKILLVVLQVDLLQADRHLYHGASTSICNGPKRLTVLDTVKEIVSLISAAVG